MISIVIPHYKNKEKFYENLKHNFPFLNGCEIIVVNDNPDISIKKEVETLFPKVFVIENKRNLGFAGAVSIGIKHAKGPYVFLLNDDVILKDNSYASVIKYFGNQNNLFAISFRQLEKNGEYVGRNKIYWANGFFRHSKENAKNQGINGWAEGGSMIFEKKKYEHIYGFDTLYSPFYWEDIDLSYRAWKAGYEIHFDPQITVEHHHESTIGSYFSKSKINTIAYRNQLMTIWKNISDFQYGCEHVAYVLKNLVLSPIKDNGEFINGFWMALLLFPQIMKKRSQQKKLWKKSDKEIFKKFK